MGYSNDDRTWKVSKYCHLEGDKATLQPCQACKDEIKYDLNSALQHLHANSSPSQAHAPAVLHRDPCNVWLENTKVAGVHSLFNKLTESLNEFSDDLKQVIDLSKDLHRYILRTGNSADESGGNIEKSRNIKFSSNNRQKKVVTKRKLKEPIRLNRQRDTAQRAPIRFLGDQKLRRHQHFPLVFSGPSKAS